jgi:hypothetical protein
VISKPHDWTRRRRLLFATVAYCAVTVGCIVYNPGDGQQAIVRGSIAHALVLLAGSCVGSYVFGVAWDDKNRIENEKILPYTPGVTANYTPHPRGDMKQ